MAQRLALVAAAAIIPPLPDGAYSLDEEEMIWQLGMFGIEKFGRRQPLSAGAPDAVKE